MNPLCQIELFKFAVWFMQDQQRLEQQNEQKRKRYNEDRYQSTS